MVAGRHEELTIERLVKSGDGVAHLGGRAVFVEGALPGERVRVQVLEVGRVLRGEVTAWLVKSPARRVPSCPLAERCGGCDWLHVDEQVQRHEKEEIVLSALEHLGGFDRNQLTLLPEVHGTRQLGYRRRAALHPVGKRLGFFGRGSHRGVEVARCPALTEPLQELPGRLADELGSTLKEVEQAQLLEASGKIAVSLHLKGAVKAKVRAAAQALARNGIGVVLVPSAGHRENFGSVELPDGELRLRPDAFSQANAEVNALLVAAAVEGLALSGTQSVLELYSGNGNFTLPLSHRAARVVAVDSSPVSMQLAQRSLAAARNVRLVQGEGLKILAGLAKEGQQYDRLLLDPPRSGALGIGPLAARLQPARLVYVACDPAALARDAQGLFRQGFRPMSLQLFDLFPQTRHIEALLVMER